MNYLCSIMFHLFDIHKWAAPISQVLGCGLSKMNGSYPNISIEKSGQSQTSNSRKKKDVVQNDSPQLDSSILKKDIKHHKTNINFVSPSATHSCTKQHLFVMELPLRGTPSQTGRWHPSCSCLQRKRLKEIGRCNVYVYIYIYVYGGFLK